MTRKLDHISGERYLTFALGLSSRRARDTTCARSSRASFVRRPKMPAMLSCGGSERVLGSSAGRKLPMADSSCTPNPSLQFRNLCSRRGSYPAATAPAATPPAATAPAATAPAATAPAATAPAATARSFLAGDCGHSVRGVHVPSIRPAQALRDRGNRFLRCECFHPPTWNASKFSTDSTAVLLYRPRRVG
jgi:hypothetical protein